MTNTVVATTTATMKNNKDSTSSTTQQQQKLQQMQQLQPQHPIDQYITLLQSQTNPNPSFIQSIILKILSDTNIYTGFSQVATLPLIQKTLQESSAIGKSLLRTLDLFAYGTYLDYSRAGGTAADNSDYVKLNDGQLLKLKLLTVVSIVEQSIGSSPRVERRENDVEEMQEMSTVPSATTRNTRRNRRRQMMNHDSSTTTTSITSNHGQTHCDIVKYSILHDVLGTNNDIRQLEDILIKCIYVNLLPSGTKLDQKNQCLIVKQCVPISSATTTSTATNHSMAAARTNDSYYNNVLCRDVNVTTDVTDMITKLELMYKKGQNVSDYLKVTLDDLNRGMVQDVKQQQNIQDKIQEAKEKVKEKFHHGLDSMMLDGDGSGDGGARGGFHWVGSGSFMASTMKKRQLKRSRGGRRG
jgi:hypothetical protein